MTEKSAIGRLKYIGYANDYKNCSESLALDMAIKALEKQVPKKVIYHDNCGNETPYQPRCPRCYEAINDTYYYCGESWCPYCGQHVDWKVQE